MADDEDDPQLGALRAAWRAMPDEDPPERGLAELMAAARAKADELARPPWWRRALAQLRRPPVLALASVMVLLGGVLVIGHRRDEVQSTATVPQGDTAPAEAPATTPPVAPAAGSTAPASPAPSSPAAGAVPSLPALAPAKAKEPERDQVPAHHAFPLRAHPPNHPPREAMPPPAALGGASNGAFARPPAGDTGGAGRDPAPPPAAERKADEAPAASDDGDEGAVRSAPETDVPAAPPPAAAAPPPAAAGAPPRAASGHDTAASLATQCRAAAARGDCATARALAAQIQRDDPTAYAQLQRDATVAACLR